MERRLIRLGARAACEDNRVSSGEIFVLVIDLLGTFAFALNGALTALRHVRLDIVGVVVLGVMTAVGGGITRDVLIGDTPPAAFRVWYYLTIAILASLVAFFWREPESRKLLRPVLVLDAVGLSLFCVVGTQKGLEHGLNPGSAILLGVITAVGGGTIRDVMTGTVPSVLTSGLYAIPALVGATITALSTVLPDSGVLIAVAGALACFAIRMVGVRYRLNAPIARAHHPRREDGSPSD